MEAKFSDLYSLLKREDFIYQAIIKLKGNKGADTRDVDRKTIDGISAKDVTSLQAKLKDMSFKFSPVKRIMIPKPGKPEKRPLGIPTFTDRVVQEMIRGVLEAVYEPVFELRHNNSNYGFRPGKGTKDAVEVLVRKAQNTEWCIEGDIKGAYDNVDHDKLLGILREKISDERFLALIKQGLKCGAIHEGTYTHTLLGTPQGGIASPILFNIYMSKLDEYVNEVLSSEISERNIAEGRSSKPVTRSYRKFESTYSSSKKVLQRIRKGQLLRGKPNFADSCYTRKV